MKIKDILPEEFLNREITMKNLLEKFISETILQILTDDLSCKKVVVFSADHTYEIEMVDLSKKRKGGLSIYYLGSGETLHIQQAGLDIYSFGLGTDRASIKLVDLKTSPASNSPDTLIFNIQDINNNQHYIEIEAYNLQRKLFGMIETKILEIIKGGD